MGYSFTIGKKVINPEYKEGNFILKYIAEEEHLLEAPAFGEPTDHTNQRWPSYGYWFSFLKAVSLFDMFYDENDKIIGGHPGYITLTKEMADEIKEKYNRYKIQYKNAVPTFDEDGEEVQYVDGKIIPVNHTMARFEWLVFWVNYSINKYDEVIISNT